MKKRGSFRKLNNLRQLDSRKAPLILHAETGWFEHILEGGCDFFEKLGQSAGARGFKPLLVHSEDIKSYALLASGHLQIVIGPKRPRGTSIFHAQPSYLPGFWYLDPKGFHWNSSLAGAAFEPDAVDADAAREFFDGVSGFFIGRNKSKRPQQQRAATPPGSASAVVFLQDIEKYREPVHWVSTAEMIARTCTALNGTVYVKPHPLQDDAARGRAAALCAQFPNAVMTDASLHELIAASDLVVSQNSAAGFEALLHKKPVITCARSDYHHATVVSRSGPELGENLRLAAHRQQSFPFEKYVYWFLGQHMLEPQKPEFEARAWSRLLAADARALDSGTPQ